MKLADYLTREGINASAFAKRIDRAPSTVSRLARGETKPDWRTLQAIVRETGGAVEPADFFDEAAA